MSHTFLEQGSVRVQDLLVLTQLTEDGKLDWRRSTGFTAYYADPVDMDACNAIGPSLGGARIGFVPDTEEWHYLRLVDQRGKRHYVEAGSPAEQMELVDRLYQIVQKAARLGGTLKSEGDRDLLCTQCGNTTPHRILVDRPHGLQGAVMAGSERLVCTKCELATPIEDTTEER